MASYITVSLPNGQVLGNIADLTINQSLCSISLIGRGATNYGQIVATDWVAMLCNFADSTAPSYPLAGQCWYNASTSALNIYNGTSWTPLLATIPITSGTYTKVIVNSSGQITSAESFSSADVVTALGYTPLKQIIVSGDVSGTSNGSALDLILASVANPGTYEKVIIDAKGRVIAGETLGSSDIVTALGYIPQVAGSQLTSLDVVNALGFSPGIGNIETFNGNSGPNIVLHSADVTTALGYTPISTVTSNNVVDALGYVPLPPVTGTAGTFTKVVVNASGQVTTGLNLLSSDITNALGFTPNGNLLAVQTFTATGTYTQTPGTQSVKIICTGGGGGGAGSNGTTTYPGGGSGAAGGTAIYFGPCTTGFSLIVGAGGAGTGSSAVGATGGTSTAGTFCHATGGTGGGSAVGAALGGSGGVGVGGNIANEAGGDGMDGANGTLGYPTMGGASYWGGGGKGGNPSGTAGRAAGSGGGGCYGSNGVGGNGANGIIVIEEYGS
jgi:hypothetical protein